MTRIALDVLPSGAETAGIHVLGRGACILNLLGSCVASDRR